jgi:serine/threonine-protein kinase
MALPNTQKIPIGVVLSGKYRITRELGRGGMAAVYEAENVDIGKRVAIKVLAQELSSSTVVVERFLREARAAAAIRSPYICDVYDSGRLDDGRPFLVLELLLGESLYERMTRVRQLDVPTTLQITSQTCRGLTKAHKATIVHRDLKPENLFVTKDEEGRVLTKILDFGLAKFYSPVEGDEKQARLTREGAVFGTPAYMSPEQVRGQGAVDHRADLWALGCIVYECLTGKTVWATEQGVAMTFAQIASSPLPDPSALRPDLPPAFLRWFSKALNRDIDQRFQSAKELADELALAFQQGPPSFSAIHDLSTLLAQLPPESSGPPESERNKGASPKPPPPKPRPPPPRPPSPRPETDIPIFESESSIGTSPMLGPADSAEVTLPGAASNAPTPPRRSSTTGDPLQASSPRPERASGAGRALMLMGLVAALGGGAYVGYRELLQPPTVRVGTPATTAVVVTTSRPSTTVEVVAASTATVSMPWSTDVRQAQQAISEGQLQRAVKHLKDGFDKGGHGVPRTLLDQVSIASAAEQIKSPCELTGLARPRTYDLVPNVRAVGAGRPSIAMGTQGPVVVWTDAHDGSEHAYAALLDATFGVAAGPFDVTPEGNAIARAELTSVEDRFVLTYWESRGAESGVHVRFLDSSGRIAGPAVAVTLSKSQNFWPSLTRASDGSFFIGWTDEGDSNSDDLFLRHLGSTLAPIGDPVRITDLAKTGGSRPRARVPALASLGDALHIAFRLERDPERLIQHLRLPFSETTSGLEPAPKARGAVDRYVGESVLVNTDRARGDAPSLACERDACILAWHGELQNGAWASYIQPARPQPLWRKKFSKLGAHPASAMATSGQGQLAWFEAGRVQLASIGRDGVGRPTKLLRVTGEQPMPSIATSNKPNEWLVAWLDYEAGHLEPYAARVLCK